MKKIILAAAAALMTLGAYAQSRPTFIVSAGYQGSNLNIKDNKSQMASGARAGVDVDFNLYDTGSMYFSVRPGVHFSMKGAKSENNFGVAGLAKLETSATHHLYYIDVPVLANVGFNAGGFGVYLNAGPYVGFGVGSSMTSTTKTDSAITDPTSDTNRSETSLFSEDGVYKRFDWGAQIGAGVEVSNFLVGVGYQIGIGDIRKEVKNVDLPAVRNNAFFVSVGYRF